MENINGADKTVSAFLNNLDFLLMPDLLFIGFFTISPHSEYFRAYPIL